MRHRGSARRSSARRLGAWAALGLVFAQDGERFREVDAGSANGFYAAEIRKAQGQERVADEIARWRLSVYELPRDEHPAELWTCIVKHRAGERIHLLSDDGHAFVALEPRYGESRALARVWRDGTELVELSTTQLGIDRSQLARDAPGAWLAEGEAAPRVEWLETQRGPVQFLALTTTYGAQRWIDLETGEVRAERDAQLELSVEPPASRAEKPGLRVPHTTRFSARTPITWGETLEVSLHAAHATPNWLFVGFEVAPADEGRALVLTPVSAPPPKNSVQLQQIQTFDATARIAGLRPGTYELRVEGCGEEDQKPVKVEVRPARALVAIHRTGGIAGMDQTFRVDRRGVVVFESRRPALETRFACLRTATLQRIAELADIVRREGAPARERPVVDGFVYELRLEGGETPFERRFGQLEGSPALRELVGLVEHAFDAR